MVKLKLLCALCVGTVAYVALSLVLGADGLYATRQLEAELTAMSLHSARLVAINTALKTEAGALREDPDVIAAYARRLGYAAPGERLIKVQGRVPGDPILRDPGTVLPRTPTVALDEWVCKLAGVVAASISFMLLLLIGMIASALFPASRHGAAPVHGDAPHYAKYA